jgi:hypothetical protein
MAFDATRNVSGEWNADAVWLAWLAVDIICGRIE